VKNNRGALVFWAPPGDTGSFPWTGSSGRVDRGPRSRSSPRRGLRSSRGDFKSVPSAVGRIGSSEVCPLGPPARPWCHPGGLAALCGCPAAVFVLCALLSQCLGECGWVLGCMGVGIKVGGLAIWPSLRISRAMKGGSSVGYRLLGVMTGSGSGGVR